MFPQRIRDSVEGGGATPPKPIGRNSTLFDPFLTKIDTFRMRIFVIVAPGLEETLGIGHMEPNAPDFEGIGGARRSRGSKLPVIANKNRPQLNQENFIFGHI